MNSEESLNDSYYFTDYELNSTNETFSIVCALDNYITILHIYYIPVLISVGLIGNLASFFVFMTTHLKMHSSSYYLAALAIVEFVFVLVLLFVLFSFNNVIDLYNKNGWCQIFVYISSVCSTLSGWLIVAFTVERFIAVQYPLQRPHICTVSRAKAIVFGLVIIALLFQSYLFWTAGIIENIDGPVCEMKQEYRDVMKIINIFDTTLTLIGPMVLIVIMNIMIARNIYLFKRRIQNKSCRFNGERNGVFLEMSISKVR